MSIVVLSEDEYEAQEYDAVVVRESVVVCVDTTDEDLRMIPLSKVNHVDADPEATVTDLPGWFYGGGDYGLVELEAFPDLQNHLEDRERNAV